MLSPGETKEICVSIENSGVTTMLSECVIKLALLSGNDEVVSSFKTDWDAKQFKGGETTVLKANVSFVGAPAGTYKLAIGLFQKEDDPNPTYNMENTTKTGNGFYVIGYLRMRE